jgi:cytosine permease
MQDMNRSDQHTGVVQRLDKLYEFDRRPVTKDKLCSWGYFAGSYAGEHVAATEFVIGALFVTWGASVVDVIV